MIAYECWRGIGVQRVRAGVCRFGIDEFGPFSSSYDNAVAFRHQQILVWWSYLHATGPNDKETDQFTVDVLYLVLMRRCSSQR